MKKVNLYTLTLFIFSLISLHAEQSIIPNATQTTLLRGVAKNLNNDVRIVTGETDHTGHGPITYYTIPFKNGQFSLSWKLDREQKTLFVFDGKKNGKATHLLKVYVNGSNSKDNNTNTLTLITYDGSTKTKKKAKIVKHSHHVKIGVWHNIKVTFKDREATIIIDQDVFKITSDRFDEGIEKSGIGHFSNRLYTKDVKVLHY